MPRSLVAHMCANAFLNIAHSKRARTLRNHSAGTTATPIQSLGSGFRLLESI